jgi:hypothetical protein
MSDIRKHAVEPTSRLHLRDAADAPLYADGEDGNPDPSKPMVAVLYGPGSKQYAKAVAARNNRLVDTLKKKGKTEKSAEEQARETADFLAACTHSLENVDYDGLEGEAKFRAVYSDTSIGFIPEQIGKHLGEWGNFKRASSTS